MSDTENLKPQGEKLKKAIVWLGEKAKERPDKDRKRLIEEAQIRYNLSPRESEFLLKYFSANAGA